MKYGIWNNTQITLEAEERVSTAIMMTGDPATIAIANLKPSAIILTHPTLEQISALCKLGYTPPQMEINGETKPSWKMLRTPEPIAFPAAETIHRKIASQGNKAQMWMDISTGFTQQELVTLMSYNYFQEGEEDQYAWVTPVLEMAARYFEDVYTDRVADEIENGENFGAIR